MVLLSSSSLCLGALGFALYLLFRRLKEYKRLCHVPGPLLAGWTDLWLLRYVVSGTLCTKLVDVCEEYGKSVAKHGRTSY
jgi:hypothetical protein